MEGLLRGKEISGMREIDRLMEAACSYDKKRFYFPIRHHSPVCAYHLMRVIESYAPDCILIEGPDNANDLLEDINDPDTEAPLAIYYSFRDKNGLLGEKRGDYRCYYPFLDYSPELVALREAARRGIKCAFIDLPYEEILLAEKEGEGLRKEDDRSSYNDDRYLSENSYIKKLVENTGLRSFDEFWEHYFEIHGLKAGTDEFLKNMLCYCVLSRASSDRQTLLEDGCLARETHMRDIILKKSFEHKRILIVTGGFHVAGLVKPDNWITNGELDLLMDNADMVFDARTGQGSFFDEKKPVIPDVFLNDNIELKRHTIDEKDKGVYLMSYSMEACDRLNGYASGMPHPMFYQRIWEGIVNSSSDDELGEEDYGILSGTGVYDSKEFPCNIYDQVILRYLVDVGKKVRRKEAYPSTYDEICALNMCSNLAGLRDKCCPGVYELIDSVLSNYVKGEYNLATDRPMRTLRKELTGKKIGRLNESAKLPPLCNDFEKMCHAYRLDVHSSTKKELTLSVFSTKKHREISSFFYRMEYLDTNFAARKKGANLRLRKDRNLIREIWEYKYNPDVMSALVDASVYGGTLKEACSGLVEKRLFMETDASKVSELVIGMFEMGLEIQSKRVADRLLAVIQADSNFFALAKAFSNITMLMDLSELYSSDMELAPIREVLVTKLLSMLIHMTGVKEESVGEMLDALKELYGVLLDKRYEEDKLYYIDVIKKMIKADDIHPSILGACQGILYAYAEIDKREITISMEGYLSGSGDRMLHAADHIRGVFYMARDILFVDDSILNMLDEYVGNTDYDTFIRMLPQLRLAFSYFTPVEIDRIAGRIAGKYNMTGEQFKQLHEVSNEEFAYGKELENKVLQLMGVI